MKGAPRAAVVVVGSEILLDGRVDTNGPHLEAALLREGIAPALRLVVGDDVGAIAEAIRRAAERADVVLVCGGLGPTFDDVTREACAEATGRPLARDAAAEAALRERYRRRSLVPAGSVFRQADVLEGAEVLANRVGSAPGQFLPGPPAIALLPGVPAEMEAMLREELLPRLRSRFEGRPPARRVFRIAGLYESEVEGFVAPAIDAAGSPGATILAAPGEVTLILRAPAGEEGAVEAAAARVREVLGEAIFAEEEVGIERAVGDLLAASGLTLATAESCTGGLLGGMVTSVPGASAWYAGGWITYADRFKEGWLGVPGELLRSAGAVSAEVAAAMARGARERTGADAALALTGVAGPGGGTPSKPVGLVHVALDAAWGREASILNLPGERSVIRLRACRLALDLLRRSLRARAGGGR